jgi:hypothetical protein
VVVASGVIESKTNSNEVVEVARTKLVVTTMGAAGAERIVTTLGAAGAGRMVRRLGSG